MNKVISYFAIFLFIIIFLLGCCRNESFPGKTITSFPEKSSISVKVSGQVYGSEVSLFSDFVRAHEINRFLTETGLSGGEEIEIDVRMNKYSIFDKEIALVYYSVEGKKRYLILKKSGTNWRIAKKVLASFVTFDYDTILKTAPSDPHLSPDNLLSQFLMICSRGDIDSLNSLLKPPGCPEISKAPEEERKELIDALKKEADTKYTKKFLINDEVAIYATEDDSRTFYCSKLGDKWYMGAEHEKQSGRMIKFRAKP